MDIRVFIRLHELIKAKQTGKLKQLAQKLEISERSVNYYIAFMRNEMKTSKCFEV
jgi:transcriptional antiterminator